MKGTFLYDFVDVIKNCSYSNTYKMAWAKSLLEIALEDEWHTHHPITISLETMAENILKYYWNHTYFFNLIQGSNPNKPPEIISIARKLITAYQNAYNTFYPERFERVTHKLKTLPEYNQQLKRVVKTLKQDVSYRFLYLNKRVLPMYQYEKKSNTFTIEPAHLKQLKNHAYMLFDIINYRWALILETYNSSPRIAKKVKITEERKIKRAPLQKYYEKIALDNPKQICFLCNKVIEETPSIDHVIPWSYLYSDDLWNLVFVHKSCNASKSNRVPDESLIKKLEARNRNLLKLLGDMKKTDKHFHELVLAERENTVQKFWIGCQ